MSANSDHLRINSETNLPELVSQLRIAAKVCDLLETYGIDIPSDCDGVVTRCLREKDYDLEKGLKQLKQFHAMMQQVMNWDAPLRPSYYDTLYHKCCYSLPSKDSTGRRIFMVKLAAWNPKEFTFDEWVISIWFMAQYSMYEFIEAQLKGVVMILDCTDLSMQHAWSIKIKRAITSAMWMQTGVSCRLKELHIIHHPRFISAMYSTIKPFLKEKMRERFHFHSDLKSLHKYFDPSILPPNLRDRGDIDDGSFYDKDFYNGLLQQDEFFHEWMEKGFPAK